MLERVIDSEHFKALKEKILGQRTISPGAYIATERATILEVTNNVYDLKTPDGEIDPNLQELAEREIRNANPDVADTFEPGQLIILPFVDALFENEQKKLPTEDGEGEQNKFPGKIPALREWSGTVGRKKQIGVSEIYNNCFDVMYEITKTGKIVTKEEIVRHALFWRKEEYTGPSAEVPAGAVGAQIFSRNCAYLAEVIHILRYQLRQKYHQKVRFCVNKQAQTLFEVPTGEPYWNMLNYLEKLHYGEPQICFIELTSKNVEAWIQNYIKEYGPDIENLGQR
ncbi:MAG: hypothetical protein MRJ65_01820 [Candidatus Brocadiaceae bacterium]|nr:hypothetical protein [Candidatus Brocadiaceae bacterium]